MHGVPAAKLAPPDGARRRDVDQAIEKLLELRKGLRLDGLSIREMIEEGRQRVTEARATSLARVLGELPIAVDDGAISGALGAVPALGRRHGLSAYDAAYLELATRGGPPLATRDARLRDTAAQIGVPLLA